jgi:hypothetical protein
MRTKNIFCKENRPLLLLLGFFSIGGLIVSCNDPETDKVSTAPAPSSIVSIADFASCDPVWAAWNVEYKEGTTEPEKTELRRQFLDSVNAFVAAPDRGITCDVSGYHWNTGGTQITVCLLCLDSDKRIGDTTMIRPPSGVKPPPGLTVTLVEGS